ncbi:hypothetical protein JCM16358_24410 [Halanaerocella petrolearia]
MKKIVSLGLILVLLVAGSALVLAHGGGFGNQGSVGRGYRYDQDYYQYQLNLSDDQLNQIEELRDEYYHQAEDIMDQLRDKNYELHELYFEQNASRDKVVGLQEEVNGLRNKLIKLRTNFYWKLRNVLTDDQLEQFADYGFGFNGTRAGYFCPGFNMRGGTRMMGW